MESAKGIEFKVAPEEKVKKRPSFLKPWLGLKYLFKKPITIKIPYEQTQIAEKYRGFHTLDWKKCIGCNMCGQICPARAIEMTWIEGEKRAHPKIDYGRCTFCQFCVDVCPTGALGHVEHYILTTEWKEEELQLFDWVPLPEEKVRKFKDYRHPLAKIEYLEDGKVRYTLRDGEVVEFRILGYGLKPPTKPKAQEKKEPEEEKKAE
ncbi:NADH-quinone oxidoreductase subunit NuoI [Thermococcus aggregans]|uniref:NADH-quinone oxidoreductase subunit NuoI n=1 Tax=Thermococcus aggregans TaxID=110163 RepID=A0A9E7MYM1_THEAG|nr:NADH-quinone oxidoreductase subunit NuoI [Thermococcus aggregans]USS41179.1 NADH-quinone oxidoreductase subunit NuoI [Thermococcus aggregans]